MNIYNDVWTRVLLNALVAGVITSASILLAMPGQKFEGPALVAALLSGILAGAREVQEHLKPEEKQPRQKNGMWRSMLLF